MLPAFWPSCTPPIKRRSRCHPDRSHTSEHRTLFCRRPWYAGRSGGLWHRFRLLSLSRCPFWLRARNEPNMVASRSVPPACWCKHCAGCLRGDDGCYNASASPSDCCPLNGLVFAGWMLLALGMYCLSRKRYRRGYSDAAMAREGREGLTAYGQFRCPPGCVAVVMYANRKAASGWLGAGRCLPNTLCSELIALPPQDPVVMSKNHQEANRPAKQGRNQPHSATNRGRAARGSRLLMLAQCCSGSMAQGFDHAQAGQTGDRSIVSLYHFFHDKECGFA